VLYDSDHVSTGDCLAAAALSSPVRLAPLPPRPDPVSSWRPLSVHLKVFPCRRRVTPASLHVPVVCRCHRCVAADASATSRRPGFRLACGSARDVRAGRAFARRRGQSGASPSISAGGCPATVLRGSSSSTSSSGPSSFIAADPGGKIQKEEDRLHACDGSWQRPGRSHGYRLWSADAFGIGATRAFPAFRSFLPSERSAV
jgi:hypothetical protein